MREALVVAIGIALLMAAAGLLLWQWAKNRQSKQTADRHLAQRIEASLAAEVPVPMPLRETSLGSAPSELTSDPWLETGLDLPTPPRKSRLETLLPDWLVGVVRARTAVIAAALILMMCALVGSFAGWLAAGGVLLLLVLVASFALWLRLQKFRRQLVSQLPAYIDSMVRLITIGNSTQAAFQLAIANCDPPLRGYLDRAASLVRAGVDLDRALHQTAVSVRIEEMYLLASILGLGVRYGGRADLLLERVANFMRDREQAEHELVAMSSETRLSAWILGLLPVGVCTFLMISNPGYFMGLWNDGTGRMLIFSAVGLQLLGAAFLYRLARLA
ncbi:tight adherence protein B [Variovorax boronicumulans]|uniref:type II secretion system F family protein n=1 Tax=Variovorax boronicumulans TaxID=436515 RepID=UPI00277DFF63|nr:type II secretion system F family protein [Variovorax boronicumulans]MDQ0072193.1 tight adherence protein B [Variovorax boronicumulans]